MNHCVETILATDAHVSGEPIRVIGSESLELQGDTIAEKRDYFARHLDYLRKGLILEPRGHENMFGAVICEPVTREGDIGLFFMDTKGYLNMCGHGTIGSVTILLEKNMLPSTPGQLDIETPSGMIRANYRMANGKVSEVSFRNVPAYVHKSDVVIDTSAFGKLTVDIVFSGNFFIMIDHRQISTELSGENLGELVGEAMEIKKELNNIMTVQHPVETHIQGMDLVQFYDTSRDEMYKNCVIFGEGQVDRSPCGTGLSGLLALMVEKGRLAAGQEAVCQSVLGTTFKGKVHAKTRVGEIDAIVPEISGTGFITADHNFILTPDDPFKEGFIL